jgi:hypothetical protein
MAKTLLQGIYTGTSYYTLSTVPADKYAKVTIFTFGDKRSDNQMYPSFENPSQDHRLGNCGTIVVCGTYPYHGTTGGNSYHFLTGGLDDNTFIVPPSGYISIHGHANSSKYTQYKLLVEYIDKTTVEA